MLRILNAAIAGTLSLAAMATSAAEVNWSVNAGAAYSDNATRSASDPVSDTIAYAGGGLDLSHESARLEASVRATGNVLTYLDDTYDNDFAGSADARLQFGLVPERFLWTFDDRFGQTSVNPFAPVTPDNRQNVNVFSTGPRIFLRLGSATNLNLSGTYRLSQYERDNEADSSRLSGSVALVRRSSPSVSWSVVGDAARTEYDLPGDPGFDVQSVYVSLESIGARQTLSINAGGTRIDGDDDSNTDPLLRLNWTRQLSPALSMDLSLGTEYQDTSDRFIADPGVPDGDTGDVVVSGIPSKTDYASLGLRFSKPRTTLSAGVRYSRDDYIDSGINNRERLSIFAGASRRMSEKVTGRLSANYTTRDATTLNSTDDTTSFGAGLDWRMSRSLYLTAGYRYGTRSSDLSAYEYDENILFISVSYRSGDAAVSPGLRF